jgi:hypothetical protein
MLCSVQQASASVRVVGFQCESNGDVNFYMGYEGFQSNGRIKITPIADPEQAPPDPALVSVTFLFTGTLFPAPSEEANTTADWDGLRMVSGAPLQSHWAWVKVTVPANQIPASPTGQYEIDVVVTLNNAAGLTLPWTTNIDCDPGEDPPPELGIAALQLLALSIRDVTLGESGNFDEFLRNRRLIRPLRRKMTVVIRLLELIELVDDPVIAEFLIQITLFKIEDDLLAKTDGFYGGNPRNDWVIDQKGQDLLYNDLAFLADELAMLL